MTKKEVKSRKKNKNLVYFLCLINWKKILKTGKPEQIETYLENIGTLPRKIGDWIKIDLDWEKRVDMISKSELGFYHSRLIFQFLLKEPLKNIADVRKIREALEDEIRKFCGDNEEGFIIKIKDKANMPYIFYYPLFELNKEEEFWKSPDERPYSLQTTCFYTELHDLKKRYVIKRKHVKMRISGAQIVTTNMSDLFFYRLINIIFHEGLYRQTRDEKLNKRHKSELIQGDLENRLEDFASCLMTFFYQYSSDYYRRGLQLIALWASMIGIGLGLLYFILRLCLQK